jgi:hypothetical protein
MFLSTMLLAGARRLRAHTITAVCTALLSALSPITAHAQGFLEFPLTLSTTVEPQLTQSEISAFLPSKGKFKFPAPYNTEAVRLTNAADCGGADCVNAIGYSYWRNINNHVGQDTMLIMVGLNKAKGGAGLSLLEFNKVTGTLTNRGPIFDANSQYGYGSGEGWYFSAKLPTKIYITSAGKILRYDVISKQMETIVDVTTQLGAGHVVQQIHSSSDDRVHSATIRNSSYAALGCMAYETDTKKFHYFPKKGEYDECQVDKSGRWLVIKENVDGAEGEDNRIIDLTNDSERLLRDSSGAGGHSDMGYGYMIAADNWAPKPNTSKVWDFTKSTLTGTLAYSNTDWSASAPNHISHSNASNAPASQQYACGSSANRRNSPQANEIICFMLDGSSKTMVVAPTMTNLDSRSGGDYDNMPKGNLDVTGQYFIWTSNMGGSRLDAFLVKVPSGLLTGSSAGTTTTVVPAPAPTTTTTTTTTTVEPAPVTSPAPTPVTEVVVNTLAPVISGLTATNIGATTALIKWTTNKPVTEHVDYGTTVNYDKSSAINSAYLSSHEVQLTGLQTGKLYHYRALMRDSAGNLAISPDMTFTTGAAGTTAPVIQPTTSTPTTSSTTTTTPTSTTTTQPTTSGTAVPVNWIETANAIGDSAGTIRRNGGCDGCTDSGAASEQRITNTGYLEFAPTVESTLRFIGLSDRNNDNTAADVDFGLRLQGNVAEVRENGAYRSETSFTAGDVLRVNVENGKVSYLRNGSVFYTSTTTPAASLRADTALYSAAASVGNVKISASAPSNSITWTNPIKVTVSGATVQKTAGCDGCPDAGAVSVEQIMSGNGYAEFKATIESGKARTMGLTTVGATDVAYGFKISGNIAEVREFGVYRSDTSVVAGDVLRVTVENGIVSYAKNGVAFYTSPTRATSTLRAGALFYNLGGTIQNAVIKTQ